MCFRRSLDGYACCCPVSSVGTVSTSDLAVALGCIGKARGPNPSPFPLVVSLVFLSLLTNRRRVGGGVSGLETLLVRFGGVELGSRLRDAGRAVGGGCVDAPRRTPTLP